MKTLINRVSTLNPFGQFLHFDDNSCEWDANCTQTTDILTAELYNGKAAKSEDGTWQPAPGPRSHYTWEFDLVGFHVGLELMGRDSDGKDIYDYCCITPTGVLFHGDLKGNDLRVPPRWQLIRVAAEVIAWMCEGEDSGAELPAMNEYQWTWVRSINRQSASAAIDEWISVYDRGEHTENTPVEEKAATDKAEELAKLYLERDVYACQSSLISDILKGSFESREFADILSWDDVENLRVDTTDMDGEACARYIQDEMGEDVSSLIDWGDYITDDDHDDFDLDDADFSLMSEDDENVLRAFIDDHASDREVFEWWLVSEWLHDQLKAIGEPVVNNGQSYWWGRTCSGQAIILDGTLQRIAQNFVQYA